MAEYTVRVERRQTSYADITLEADTMEEAIEQIEAIEEVCSAEEADNLNGRWECYTIDLEIAWIKEEASYDSLAEMKAAWEATKNHEAV